MDDHEIFRNGLRSILEEFPEFILIGEASNAPEAIKMCSQYHPDVVLMDIHMPGGNGNEAVVKIKQNTKVRVLMLTVSEKDQDLLNAIQSGADGYLLKNTKPDQLRSAIHNVLMDISTVAPEVTKALFSEVSRAEGTTPELSIRERHVMTLLAGGSTTQQISDSLNISENTTKTHIRHILNKLKASNRAEAVARASELGLLS
ncbi:MAG: response regulator transcription factor [Anaerolineae bacterium]|nr:response regulator transcription factor [Anaerolineae bacterium]